MRKDELKKSSKNQAAHEQWYDIAEKAEWKNLSDIKADFPTTDYVGNQHYVFDIRGLSRETLMTKKKFGNF